MDRVTVQARIDVGPTGPQGSGLSRRLIMDSQPQASAQSSRETLSIAATDSAPYVVPGPYPAAVIDVRVTDGGPVKVLLTSPDGVDQAFWVDPSFHVSSPSPIYTSIKLVGTATLELWVA